MAEDMKLFSKTGLAATAAAGFLAPGVLEGVLDGTKPTNWWSLAAMVASLAAVLFRKISDGKKPKAV